MDYVVRSSVEEARLQKKKKKKKNEKAKETGK